MALNCRSPWPLVQSGRSTLRRHGNAMFSGTRLCRDPSWTSGAPRDAAVVCRYQDLRQDTVSEVVERVVVSPVFRAAPWDQERLTEQELKPKASILLISESDVCRTVLAAAALERLLSEAGLEDDVVVTTCGTRPYNIGDGPEPAAAAAAAKLGLTVPPGHAARLFNPAADIVAHDLLLVMDKFTAGDVMREVSSFDLVNRSAQFSYKVRRLGEFIGGFQAKQAQEFGDEQDIEDPLYGNVGGPEEERAVARASRAISIACGGLVSFLLEVKAEAAGSPGEAEAGLEGDEEVACELPLPGQAPVCSSTSGSASDMEELVQVAPLGPALRARVATMGPTPWLVPPMLSPRVDTSKF
ncbi:hypothetical protein TSOC_001350 [Tetrabaena socialis]|uniref:protein-tyrosine-phosphatase n=1 Tax=Tetrabaena socialis TaxID=47790 RepID=A0A2J8AH01_9CHLO|nr:hypothetical protein TSOC_001350 [Tetrabaena socialis]|eukprot:PNH11781.1 hypothetical protein TSOC_001350 [Tetrabaena socialis]